MFFYPLNLELVMLDERLSLLWLGVLSKANINKYIGRSPVSSAGTGGSADVPSWYKMYQLAKSSLYKMYQLKKSSRYKTYQLGPQVDPLGAAARESVTKCTETVLELVNLATDSAVHYRHAHLCVCLPRCFVNATAY